MNPAGSLSPLSFQDNKISVRQVPLSVWSGNQQPPASGDLLSPHLRERHQAVRQVADTALPWASLLCSLHHLEAAGAAGCPGAGG